MDDTKGNDGLKYVGDGTAFIGVPARDLTAQEVAELPVRRVELLASGLYVEYKKAYMPKPTKAALKGIEAENKE